MSYNQGGSSSYGQPGPSSSNNLLHTQFAESLQSEFESQRALQASIYQPHSSGNSWLNANSGSLPAAMKGKARKTVLRKGAGYTWEDPTLLEWDPKHFRLFLGNLGNDVNDDDLEKVFGNDSALGVKTFVKAKVIRDRTTTKTKGFGFVAYESAEDYMKAWKAMDGKYVGSRPITIKKATTGVRAVDIGEKKARKLESDLKKKLKEGGPMRFQRGGGTVAQQAGTSYIRR